MLFKQFLQILHLQERYDKMVEASKSTGGAYFFKPLRSELNDTFTAMSNVAPDCVFSSRKGHIKNPNSMEEGDDENIDSSPEDAQKDKKKANKSKKTYTDTHITCKNN